ncbi:hypothetical protein ACFX2H_028648 [Malus domestica]
MRTSYGRGSCGGKRDRAFRTREARKWLTKTSFDLLWRRMMETVRASRRVLMLLRMAPAMGTAKWFELLYF